jgi:hypothetical protein
MSKGGGQVSRVVTLAPVRQQPPVADEAVLRELLTRAYVCLPVDAWRGALGREIRAALGNPLPSDAAPADVEPEHET